MHYCKHNIIKMYSLFALMIKLAGLAVNLRTVNTGND